LPSPVECLVSQSWLGRLAWNFRRTRSSCSGGPGPASRAAHAGVDRPQPLHAAQAVDAMATRIDALLLGLVRDEALAMSGRERPPWRPTVMTSRRNSWGDGIGVHPSRKDRDHDRSGAKQVGADPTRRTSKAAELGQAAARLPAEDNLYVTNL